MTHGCMIISYLGNTMWFEQAKITENIFTHNLEYCLPNHHNFSNGGMARENNYDIKISVSIMVDCLYIHHT